MLAAPLLLAACGGGGTVTADCLPQASWTRVAAAQAQEATGAAGATTGATVYFDQSASMVGYLRGSRGDLRPLQDLAQTLPQLAAMNGHGVSYKGFGGRIVDLGDDGWQQAQREPFYLCRPGAACNSGTTSLATVFGAVAGEPNQLSIIVTDLWPADPNSNVSGQVDLDAPLQRIFGDGRAVAVVGILAPYAGRITDLPRGTPAVSINSAHPLFLIAVGRTDDLVELRRRLGESSSSMIRTGLAQGTVAHYALFTPTPFRPEEVAAFRQHDGDAFNGHDGNGLEAWHLFDTASGLDLPQFRLSRGGVPTTPIRPATLRRWTSPGSSDAISGAVWDGGWSTSGAAWLGDPGQCPAGNWSADASPAADWTRPDAHGSVAFPLDPDKLADRYTVDGTYLISGRVTPVFAADGRLAAAAWMQEWSRTSDQAIADAGRAGSLPYFGTLNLAEFAHILAVGLAESSRRHPRPVAGFTAALQLRP